MITSAERSWFTRTPDLLQDLAQNLSRLITHIYEVVLKIFESLTSWFCSDQEPEIRDLTQKNKEEIERLQVRISKSCVNQEFLQRVLSEEREKTRKLKEQNDKSQVILEFCRTQLRQTELNTISLGTERRLIRIAQTPSTEIVLDLTEIDPDIFAQMQKFIVPSLPAHLIPIFEEHYERVRNLAPNQEVPAYPQLLLQYISARVEEMEQAARARLK
jgi:hypothetical protein